MTLLRILPFINKSFNDQKYQMKRNQALNTHTTMIWQYGLSQICMQSAKFNIIELLQFYQKWLKLWSQFGGTKYALIFDFFTFLQWFRQNNEKMLWLPWLFKFQRKPGFWTTLVLVYRKSNTIRREDFRWNSKKHRKEHLGILE